MSNIASKAPTSRFTQGYLICLAGTTLWSFTAIFISYLVVETNMPALTLAAWRDLLVAIGLVLFFWIFRRPLLSAGRSNMGFLLLYGLVVALFNSLWTISVAYNGAAVSTVLAYSSAAFSAVLGWRLFHERLGLRKILAVILSLTGCVFVSGAYDPSSWQLNAIGVITGLLSGIGFAAYSLMGKFSSHRLINPWTTLMYSFLFAGLFILLFNLFQSWLPAGIASTDFFWLRNDTTAWLVLVSLAWLPTIGGYGLYTVSLGYLPISVANLIATLEPALTAAWAYLLLGERMALPQIFGSVLIITGVLLLRINGKQEIGETDVAQSLTIDENVA
jgi:drug/metabolite transporter (DMT)-like permease